MNTFIKNGIGCPARTPANIKDDRLDSKWQ